MQPNIPSAQIDDLNQGESAQNGPRPQISVEEAPRIGSIQARLLKEQERRVQLLQAQTSGENGSHFPPGGSALGQPILGGNIAANFQQQQRSLAQRPPNYLQNSNKHRIQSSMAERKKRAEDLMARIQQLRKPQDFDSLSCIMDSQRILQTLVNTHNYELKTNQLDVKNLKEDPNLMPQLQEDRKSTANQNQQDVYEIKEARQIMNKRRKKMPLIEEIDQDEIFSEDQIERMISSNKRQKLGSCYSEMTKVSDLSDSDLSVTATRVSPSSDIFMANEEREIVKAQLMHRCHTSYQKAGLLTIKPKDDVVSTRLVSLKEQCRILLINYLTAAESDHAFYKQAEQDFFNDQVAEQHPDLLVDICDYWLHHFIYHIPSKVSESIDFVLGIIESRRNIILYDISNFKKWLGFVKQVPVTHNGQDYQAKIYDHIKEIMKFSNFKKTSINIFLREFILDKVITKNQFLKSDSLENKQKFFDLISNQLLSQTQIDSLLSSVFNLLMIGSDSTPLVKLLDESIYTNFKSQVISSFKSKSSELQLSLFTQLFNLDADQSLIQVYLQSYKNADPSFKKVMLQNSRSLISNNETLIQVLKNNSFPDTNIVKVILSSFTQIDEDGQNIFKIIYKMYDDGNLQVCALIEFVQYAKFDQLKKIMSDLIDSDSFKITMVKALVNHIMSKFDSEQVQQLVYQMMTANSGGNQSDILQKQIQVTDLVQSMQKEEMLLRLLKSLIENKVWHCKIILRTIIQINSKDHKYLEQTFPLVKQMVELGICQDMKEAVQGQELLHNLKMGLAIFIVTQAKTSEEKKQMQDLFNNSFPKEIQKEMLKEKRFEKLQAFIDSKK